MAYSLKRPRIGALVGMGPNSTGPFYDSVMNSARELYGAKYDIDFPEMVLFSVPTPFYPDRPIDDELMRAQLKMGIEVLTKAEVDFIVIPCNVVHIYYSLMQGLTAVPVFNIMDLAVASLKAPAEAKTALIATTPTVDSTLYQEKLSARGFVPFHTPELQTKVIALLTELKANRFGGSAHELWGDLVAFLEAAGCSHAVIACTDITPCIPLRATSIQFVDSAGVLGKATIEEYLRRREISSVPIYAVGKAGASHLSGALEKTA